MVADFLFFIAFAGLTVCGITLVVGIVRGLLLGKAVSPFDPLFTFLTATFYVSFFAIMMATLIRSIYTVR